MVSKRSFIFFIVNSSTSVRSNSNLPPLITPADSFVVGYDRVDDCLHLGYSIVQFRTSSSEFLANG